MKSNYNETISKAQQLVDNLALIDKKMEALFNERKENISQLSTLIPIECDERDKPERVNYRFSLFKAIVDKNLDFHFNGKLDPDANTARIMSYGDQFAIEFLKYYDTGNSYGYARNVPYIFDTLEEAETEFIRLIILNRIKVDSSNGTIYRYNL